MTYNVLMGILNPTNLTQLAVLYTADTWSMTKASSQSLDALDQWCLRHLHLDTQRIRGTYSIYSAYHQRGSEA